MRGGDPGGDLLDQLAQRAPVLGPVRAQRPARARVRGDHVLGAAALEHADASATPALSGSIRRPSLGVERDHDLRDRQDRVAPEVGVGAVRGLRPRR